MGFYYDNKRKPVHEMDEQPYYYCKDCLSPAIISDGKDGCHCDECGSVEIATCSVKEWNEMYKARYGYTYINKDKVSDDPDMIIEDNIY